MSGQGLVEPFLAQAVCLGGAQAAGRPKDGFAVANLCSPDRHFANCVYRRRFRVRAAFFAARERLAALRLLATRLAWRDKAFLEAERRLSRLSALRTARE